MEKQKHSVKNSITDYIEWLAQYGASTDGGVTRLLYTKEWMDAQLAVKTEMSSFGLETRFDDVGNVFGRLSGTQSPDEVIVTGSHIDTVINGGKYDGAYGVLAAMLAIKQLKEAYGAPKKTLEAVSLCEEEGSRFPMTYWGSGNMTGVFSLQDGAEPRDESGVSLQTAMHECGFGKGVFQPAYRTDISAFVELHIEQGQTLEMSGRDLGIVTSIAGQRRYLVTLEGECNHAGTTSMKWRKDPLAASSRIIHELLLRSEEQPEELRLTCGKITAEPNVANVIPGRVQFSIDIRHQHQHVLKQFHKDMVALINGICHQKGIRAVIDEYMQIEPVPMDERLKAAAFETALENGISCEEMVSGAGHDAQMIGRRYPACMLFVPSRGGISHSPKEYTPARQLEIGVRALTDLLHKLAY
ncbi:MULTISPECIES: allantoate deiminase [Bacillus]|uniref:allantoate deiminase n=1 Tax=Bacillus TaxID=1386 RepID=UPI0002597F53|nr:MULTISPECIES: allantoate deiminase [Bacillus]OEI75636.1 allantoate amidohydrolase [Bacillus subtilis]AFI29820.1 allantoate amidohydrolase [Bacillus sp. JS]MEC2112542.1 allantoate deiminase [Bacillus stercoris]MEC3617313.1 allantoate deiminase [Bacillus stercoris]QRZ92123.1 allantoate deiminase [Bacillus sp. LJBS06]